MALVFGFRFSVLGFRLGCIENAGDGGYRAGVIPEGELVSSENPGLRH
jgi:hypothetical protein